MISFRSADDGRRRDEAADWVVRLAGTEPDALAFDGWLQADPRNGDAYDAALAVWGEYGRTAAVVERALADRSARRPARRRVALGLGAAAAAAAVAFVLLPPGGGPVPQAYATAAGEHRTVKLADGSSIELNGATRLTVRLERGERRVDLDHGQALFAVTHDARRPFTVAAGDRTIRDVGTEFDVRRLDGRLAVTVAEGAVDVRPAEGGQGMAYRLHPGQQLTHVEGAATAQVGAVAPSEAMAWRTGRLIYRGAPLREVVADLNQQFSRPIRIADPELAQAPISGVLVLDDQDAVIRRLALLVPISAIPSESGLILRREGAPRR